jgi:hypothetical protein
MFDHPHAIGAKAEHRTQKSLSIECGVETDISISKWTRLYLDNKHLLDILEEGTQGWGKAVEVTSLWTGGWSCTIARVETETETEPPRAAPGFKCEADAPSASKRGTDR